MTARRIVSLVGADALHFLQGLVTSDVMPLASGPGLVWTALLTPQGKYLADFFVARSSEALLLDMPEGMADDTLRRLGMYRLRADVAFGDPGLALARGTGAPPPGALADPRHPALGWRRYGPEPGVDATDWTALRVAHLIPESGVELIPGESYPLECGFERLHGVDFRKGCYVGQEVTARMKHKTELRKGLARVAVEGEAAEGDEIMAGDRPAGTLHTVHGDRAIAWLRFDRMEGEMTAGRARLRRIADDAALEGAGA